MQQLQFALALVAAVGLLAPARLVYGEPLPVRDLPARNQPARQMVADLPTIVDVALADGGMLSGQVLDASSVPLANRPVAVFQDGRGLTTTQTDSQGRFRLSSLAGGLYEVRCEHGAAVCRLWTADAAPPSAKGVLLVVSNSELARGQRPYGNGNSNWLKGPIPWIAAITAATAIAVAMYQSQKPRSPAS